jgi:hypothetical protein
VHSTASCPGRARASRAKSRGPVPATPGAPNDIALAGVLRWVPGLVEFTPGRARTRGSARRAPRFSRPGRGIAHIHLSNSPKPTLRRPGTCISGAGRRPFPVSFSLAGEGHGAPGGAGRLGEAPWRTDKVRPAPLTRRRMPLKLQRGRRLHGAPSWRFLFREPHAPAPAFAPKLAPMLRSRVVVPDRRSRTSRARGYEPRPQDARSRSVFRIASRTRPLIERDARLYHRRILQSIHYVVDPITFP